MVDSVRKRLRARLGSGALIVAPGIYDAYGARFVEQAGFEAVYMTGNGVSASLLGRPDVGLVDLTLIASHAHRVAATLPQWTGARFDARGYPVFRVAGSATAPLAKLLELIEFQVITGQVQETVEQHTAVPRGKDKAVTIGPSRVGGTVFQMFKKQDGGKIGRAHGHARVAAIGLLHAIHGQSANRIGNQTKVHSVSSDN